MLKIRTIGQLNWMTTQLSSWPTGLGHNGLWILVTVKDEKRWAEALDTVGQQGGAATLGSLKAVLFAEV